MASEAEAFGLVAIHQEPFVNSDVLDTAPPISYVGTSTGAVIVASETGTTYHRPDGSVEKIDADGKLITNEVLNG